LRPEAARIPSDSALSSPIERQSTSILPVLTCHGTSGAGPRLGSARPEVDFRNSVKSNRLLCRRRPALRPQAGEILASQVPEDSLDDRLIFDARNNLDRAATFWASLYVDGSAISLFLFRNRRIQ